MKQSSYWNKTSRTISPAFFFSLQVVIFICLFPLSFAGTQTPASSPPPCQKNRGRRRGVVGGVAGVGGLNPTTTTIMKGTENQPAFFETVEDDSTAETKTAVATTTTTTTSSSSSATATATTTSKLQRIPTALQPRDDLHVYSTLIAGAGSGALASILCAPLDLIRTRLQVWGDVHQGQHGGMTMIPNMIRDILKQDGWRGCFRGLGATLFTVPAFWGVYFPLYDDCKRHLMRRYPNANPAWIHMSSAVMSGIVSDIVCNPMFVVRTRLQTESLHGIHGLGIIQTAKALYQEGGPLIFWRGMTANMLGLSHVAVQFPAYEKLKKTLRGPHKRHESALDLLFASGLSKMTASLLTYPHEVIRSRMMDSRQRVGFWQTCRTIHRTGGWLEFYAGLPISLIRVIPNTCITFMTYELLSRWAREKIKDYRSWQEQEENKQQERRSKR